MAKGPQPAIEITNEMRANAEKEIVAQSKRIDFYLTEFSIEILANKMAGDEYVVPDYQREFTWEPERKSRFIESIIMGLPIPFLFFWEMDNGKLEIVDGSQRLRTLAEFILGEFRLGELDSLPKISGFRFLDLPEGRQRKIKNRSIRGIVLNEHADEQARFDMFERINTSSKAANDAEVRRGALAGPFMDMVISLAENPIFLEIAPVSEKQRKEREREELVIRFFAYGDGLEGYKDRPREFIFKYAKKMNVEMANNPMLVNEYRRRFEEMVLFVQRHFANGFRRTPNGKATPRARFESLAIGSAWALNERPEIIDHNLRTEEWVSEGEFSNITGSDGANAIFRLRSRIEYVRNRLLGAE